MVQGGGRYLAVLATCAEWQVVAGGRLIKSVIFLVHQFIASELK